MVQSAIGRFRFFDLEPGISVVYIRERGSVRPSKHAFFARSVRPFEKRPPQKYLKLLGAYNVGIHIVKYQRYVS